ncbi:dynein light chain 2, cytoplasmic isoform X1 [Dama dama]|uniref:dynein light chain 2, cytoplasmic isoform X1 n=1 Tax=Dama dama TaxID=30532 RepID=UPI002A35B9BC|nr:dynein light chain 2, cytoplasmic isoform X1 [Dama dama]
MSDRKAVIKNADMSEDMQQDAVDCATQAMEKYNIEKDIAAYIKKMGLIIYVSLLLLTPKPLSLPFDPQDNAFLSWAHSYAAFHNRSNCWVCGALPSSSVEVFLWWTSPLQGKDILQVCKYLQQQSYVMTLLHLMTSNNLKMD